MNDKIATLAQVVKIDHAAAIAAGLEELAAEIRSGTFRFKPDHCAIVLMGRAYAGGDFAQAYYGSDSSAAEVIGMLELAKLQVAQQHD